MLSWHQAQVFSSRSPHFSSQLRRVAFPEYYRGSGRGINGESRTGAESPARAGSVGGVIGFFPRFAGREQHVFIFQNAEGVGKDPLPQNFGRQVV